MTREQLEHILRAASKIADERDVLVICSQSVLGSFTEEQLPHEATASMEADVAFLDDPEDAKADQVDAAIGELSDFRESFGFYAQGSASIQLFSPQGGRTALSRSPRRALLPAEAYAWSPMTRHFEARRWPGEGPRVRRGADPCPTHRAGHPH